MCNKRNRMELKRNQTGKAWNIDRTEPYPTSRPEIGIWDPGVKQNLAEVWLEGSFSSHTKEMGEFPSANGPGCQDIGKEQERKPGHGVQSVHGRELYNMLV